MFADVDLAFKNAPPPDESDEADDEAAAAAAAPPREFNQHHARDACFRAFVSMLRSYRDFIIFPSAANPHPPECFDAPAFIRKQPAASAAFFTQLCQAQAFQRFIEDRTYPSENHSMVLFFDESVVAKLNRATFARAKETPFLNDKSFAITKTFVASAADASGLRREGYRYERWPTLDHSLFAPPRYVAPLETETLRSTAIGKHRKAGAGGGSGGGGGGSSNGGSGSGSQSGGGAITFSSTPGYLSRATSEANTYAIWFMLVNATTKKGVAKPVDMVCLYDVYQRIKVEQLLVDESVRAVRGCSEPCAGRLGSGLGVVCSQEDACGSESSF
jgi:uncharacterized membrane protein YgcG